MNRTPRLIGVTLAGVGVVWVVAAMMALPASRGVQRVGDRIARGETFRPETLRSWADLVGNEIGATCDIRFLTAGLYVLASATDLERRAADLAAIDRRIVQLRDAAKRTLTCYPTHGFAWLVMYWLEINQTGFGTRSLAMLQRSYRVAPRETWISVSRNPIAMKLLPVLPPELRAHAIDEYLELVSTLQFSLATDLYAGFDDTLRLEILDRLAEVPYPARSGFAHWLRRIDPEVTVPGVAAPSERPWLR